MKRFKRHYQANGRTVVNVHAYYSMETKHFVEWFALIHIPPPRKAAGYAENRNTLLVLIIVTVVCTVATKTLSTVGTTNRPGKGPCHVLRQLASLPYATQNQPSTR